MPQNKNEDKPKARWSFNKSGGWAVYERKEDEIVDKIVSVVDINKITIAEAMKWIDTLENNIRFKAFGKATYTKKSFDKVPKVKYMEHTKPPDEQTKT